MATKRDLQGAFGSLSDTLMRRFDPAASEAVRERWVGAIAHHASVARRFADWLALERTCEFYDPAIGGLNAATIAIVIADEDGERLAALDMANDATAATGRLLDDNPCGEVQF